MIKMNDEEIYIPDTSSIIEGFITKLLKEGKIKGKLIIHSAVISELEHQANVGKEIGFMGLDEIKEIRKLSEEGKIFLDYAGSKPSPQQIKYAKKGEIDSLIRDLAGEMDGILITSDRVQAEVAKALGIKLMFIEIKKKTPKIKIEKFFDENTMSIHLKEGVEPKAKKGTPGNWDFVPIKNKKLSKEEIVDFVENLMENSKFGKNSFVEIERKGSTIIQIDKYRIIITRPPFSDGYEITATRPVKELELEEYNLDKKLVKRLEEKAEGILICGAPGHGKSTFAQALAKFYLSKNKIVKTIEAPRDLHLPEEITQYSKNLGSNDEIHDILLLSRPDYTIFDEMRTTNDFKLFTDLRLAGIGLAGVIHGTTPIDAIQRFVGRIDLGMIPSIIDTVLFIKEGRVDKTYELSITVKIPTGMFEQDLARPVIEIRDFDNNKLVYEMYTFGEETVVVPINKDMIKESEKKQAPIKELAKEGIIREIQKKIGKNEKIEVDIPYEGKAIIFVPKEKISLIIGKNGKTIKELEHKLNLSIDIKEMSEEELFSEQTKTKVNFSLKDTKNKLVIDFGKKLRKTSIKFYVNNEHLFTATTNNDGKIKLTNKSELYHTFINSLESRNEIIAYV